jgi:DNA-binding NtrC family response regulator
VQAFDPVPKIYSAELARRIQMSGQKYTSVERTTPSNFGRRAGTPAPVLLASSRSEDLSQVPALVPREQWMLIKVSSWSHVLQLVSAVIIPVVLCDRDLPGLDWPRGLQQLRQGLRPPAFILVSDLEAVNLWQDAVCYGVFDMLFRPLRRERLITALDLARVHWDMRLDSDNRS